MKKEKKYPGKPIADEAPEVWVIEHLENYWGGEGPTAYWWPTSYLSTDRQMLVAMCNELKKRYRKDLRIARMRWRVARYVRSGSAVPLERPRKKIQEGK